MALNWPSENEVPKRIIELAMMEYRCLIDGVNRWRVIESTSGQAIREYVTPGCKEYVEGTGSVPFRRSDHFDSQDLPISRDGWAAIWIMHEMGILPYDRDPWRKAELKGILDRMPNDLPYDIQEEDYLSSSSTSPISDPNWPRDPGEAGYGINAPKGCVVPDDWRERARAEKAAKQAYPWHWFRKNWLITLVVIGVLVYIWLRRSGKLNAKRSKIPVIGS